MSNSTPHPQPLSFWSRIPLAFGAFFSTLSDPAYAARVRALSEPTAAPVAPAPAAAPTRAPEPAPVRPLKEASPDAALQPVHGTGDQLRGSDMSGQGSLHDRVGRQGNCSARPS